MSTIITSLQTSRLIASPKLSLRQNVGLISGIGPDGLDWDFHVMHDRADFAASRGMGEALTLAQTVRSVMKDGNALIFQGLVRDGYVEGLSYVGCPPVRFNENGTPRTPADDDVFFVFITEERVIYTWRWETVPKSTYQDPTFGKRFSGRVR